MAEIAIDSLYNSNHLVAKAWYHITVFAAGCKSLVLANLQMPLPLLFLFHALLTDVIRYNNDTLALDDGRSMQEQDQQVYCTSQENP